MSFSYTTVVILSYSIFISGIIGAVRFNQIRDIYKPFIYLIWIGCFNESLSTYLALNHHYTIINGAIYSLCESLLLLWFFRLVGAIRSKAFLFSLAVIFVSIWIIENVFANQFGATFSNYSDITYSFCIVLLSIRAINNLLFTERVLLKNPTFLICIGLIIFFTYEIMERSFRIYGLKNSTAFQHNVQGILILVNLLSNLIYALAVLWMRKRQAFTMQF